MAGADWTSAINRLILPPDLPVTLQGGEPTTHKDFVAIVNGIRPDIHLDLLTNFERPLKEWLYKTDPARWRREAPYAPIRISWHRGQHALNELLDKVLEAQKRHYPVGVWTVDHPEYREEVRQAQLQAWNMGIDFRLKEFLGPWEGEIHGTFRYPAAVDSHVLRFCECRTSELLIAPDGHVYRCHSDVYAARFPIGHILDNQIPLIGQDLPCAVYGKCNSCDIKLKYNRFQEEGHSSVAIRNISEPYAPNPDYVHTPTNTYGKPQAPADNIRKS